MTTPPTVLKSTGIQAIITGLSSRNTGTRKDAEAALQGISPAQMDELVAIQRGEVKRIMGRMGIWFALMAGPMVYGPVWLTFGNAGGLPPSVAALLFLGFLGAYMLLFPKLVAQPRRQYALLYSAIAIKNSRMLGPLITRTGSRTAVQANLTSKLLKRLYKLDLDPAACDQALIEVANNIQTGEEIDLTGQERRTLRQLLWSQNSSIVLCLIKVLDKTGGNADLAILRSLATGARFTKPNLEVQQAAAACIETIEARLNQQKVPETLLRASQSSTPSATLVRPANTANIEGPQVLLRPGLETPTKEPAVLQAGNGDH